MEQAGCTDKFSCAELPYVPSAVAVGAVSAPRQDWDWALCRELAGQERGWSLKNSDVLSQVPCGTVSRQLLWVGRKLPWVFFFFLNALILFQKHKRFLPVPHCSHLYLSFSYSNPDFSRQYQLCGEEQKATLVMPGTETSLFLCITCEQWYITTNLYPHLSLYSESVKDLWFGFFCLFQVCGWMFIGQSRF